MLVLRIVFLLISKPFAIFIRKKIMTLFSDDKLTWVSLSATSPKTVAKIKLQSVRLNIYDWIFMVNPVWTFLGDKEFKS